MSIYEWAVRWNVPRQALSELINMLLPDPTQKSAESEAKIQQDLRLRASQIGACLWRNNSGVAQDATGRHIRYGLGNDSKRINDQFKSSDLIGITPLAIMPEHVGHTVGVFTAVEVKRGDWQWSGTDREQAQWKYMQVVASRGGYATFATSVEDYMKCLTNV